MTLTEVGEFIKERYNIKYSAKQVGVIIGKLGYEYRKKQPRLYKPEFED